jgi:hypothetical protein
MLKQKKDGRVIPQLNKKVCVGSKQVSGTIQVLRASIAPKLCKGINEYCALAFPTHSSAHLRIYVNSIKGV